MPVSRRVFLGSIAACGSLVAVGEALPADANPIRANRDPSSTDHGYRWTPVTITGGGFVTGMVIHPRVPGVMYARCDVGGAWRWNASTETWSQIITVEGVEVPLKSDYYVSSIALAPETGVIYIAAGNLGQFDNTGPGRVLKSSDHGRTWFDSGTRWTIRGNGMYRTGSERLAVDPAAADVVYFGTEEQGLWRTTDAGRSWQQLPTGQIPTGTPAGVGAGVRFVLFDPTGGTSDGRTTTIYVGVSGSGVYVSRDAGQTWSQDLSSSLIPADAKIAGDGTLLVSFWNGDLLRRDPATGTWSTISPLPTSSHYLFGVDPGNSQLILVTDNAIRPGFLFRSNDGGQTWDSLDYSAVPVHHWLASTISESFLNAGTFVFDPHVRGQVWLPGGRGVWRTQDITGSTVDWSFVTTGIEELVTMDAVAPPGGKLVTAVADWNGFRHDRLDRPPQQTILTSQASSGTSVNYSGRNPQFVAAISSDQNHSNPDQSGFSTDGGKSWTQFGGSRNYADLFGGNIAVSATDMSNLVWLPTNKVSPYVSGDQGVTWTKLDSFDAIATGLHDGFFFGFKRALDADKVDGSYFYVYSTVGAGQFYRSADGGQTWDLAPDAPVSAGGGVPGCHNQIHATPGHAGHVWASTLNGLFVTRDHGDTWAKVPSVESAEGFGFGKPIKSYPTIFLSGTIRGRKGIWRSDDFGGSWKLLTEYPDGYYAGVTAVSGDMSIPGRVYLGLEGNSFVYGENQ